MGIEHIIVWGMRALLIALCIWALFRGGGPERTGSALLLGGYLGQLLIALAGFPIDFSSPSKVHLVYTGLLFLGSLALAVHSNRVWPLFFSAFYLVELTGHFSVVFLEHGRSIAYWMMTQLPIILQALILGIGTIAFLSRLRTGVNAPDWRNKIIS